MFGKKVDPKEQAREWTRNLKKEMRSIDRDIREIQREQLKIKQDIKKQAKKGDKKALSILAKSMVKSNKTITNLVGAKAEINSAVMQINEQIATMKVVGAMQQSAGLMRTMNRLVNVPQIQQTTMSMAREMQKAGVISEMVNDAFESIDDEDVEEMAEDEVNKIIQEITDGKFDSIAAIANQGKAKEQEEEEEEEDEEEAKVMADRLANIKA
jgi:charged multivesicular body protein 3